MLKREGKPGSAVGMIGGGPRIPAPSTTAPPMGSTPRTCGVPGHVGSTGGPRKIGTGAAAIDQRIETGDPAPNGTGPSAPPGTVTTILKAVPGGVHAVYGLPGAT